MSPKTIKLLVYFNHSILGTLFTKINKSPHPPQRFFLEFLTSFIETQGKEWDLELENLRYEAHHLDQKAWLKDKSGKSPRGSKSPKGSKGSKGPQVTSEAELQFRKQEALKALAKFEKKLSFHEGNFLGPGHFRCLVVALRKHPYLVVELQHNFVTQDSNQLVGIAEIMKEALSATPEARAAFGVKNRCKFRHDVCYFPEGVGEKVRRRNTSTFE
jgi:hypothetical protein